MNQKAQYEITIAEKLEQLTVPDMVDAIWSRIEAQLDIEMPPDDGPAEPPSHPPAGSGSWMGAGMMISLAAFVITLFLTNKKNQTPANSGTGNGNNSTIVTPGQKEPGQSLGPPGTSNSPGQARPGDQLSQPGSVLFGDSLPGQGDAGIQIPSADTVLNADAGTAKTPPSLPQQVVTDTNKKKGRGVKGITDNDYRVVPARKDSSK